MKRSSYEDQRERALDALFLALSDPTRRAILTRLLAGEATVGEIAAPFAMSQPAISKHLGALERAGLLSRRREGARRPCRLQSEALADAAEWLEDLRLRAQPRPEALDDVLLRLKARARDKPGASVSGSQKRRNKPGAGRGGAR